jgi:hypothetical protein
MSEAVSFRGSQLIDVDLLIRKTRDSFLVAEEGFRRAGMIDFEGEHKQAIKQWLREQLTEKRVSEILLANSGKISKPTFETLIAKIGLVLKKSSVCELFEAFSKGEDFVMIEDLTGVIVESKE